MVFVHPFGLCASHHLDPLQPNSASPSSIAQSPLLKPDVDVTGGGGTVVALGGFEGGGCGGEVGFGRLSQSESLEAPTGG